MLGEKHLETLTNMSNLGMALSHQEKYAEAEEMRHRVYVLR